MTLLAPQVGEVIALKAMLNALAGQDQKLKLYKSNTTPANTDTAATYTESTWTGYALAALTGTSWVVTPGNPSSAAYAQQTFTSSANQTLENTYGYFVIQTTSGTIIWAERFTGAPYPIQNLNDAIAITPQITMT